jgi:hypothetical protein
MGLRSWLKRLERGAREDLGSFELLDGSTYYYDRMETYKELFMHAYDVQLGEAHKWPEPPEVYRQRSTARCVRLGTRPGFSSSSSPKTPSAHS